MLKKWIVNSALVCTLLAAGGVATAQAQTVSLRYGNAHTFWVEGTPTLELVPTTTVYYTTGADYDLYRMGDYYYVNNGAAWYRSTTVAGPYTMVAATKVPQQIVVVPQTYRRYDVKPHGKDPWGARWKVVKVKS